MHAQILVFIFLSVYFFPATVDGHDGALSIGIGMDVKLGGLTHCCMHELVFISKKVLIDKVIDCYFNQVHTPIIKRTKFLGITPFGT